MTREFLDPEVMRLLGRLEAGIEWMKKLADEMMIYSELMQPYTNQPVNLNALITDVVTGVQSNTSYLY